MYADIIVIDCLQDPLMLGINDHGTLCSAVAIAMEGEPVLPANYRVVAPNAKLIVNRITDKRGYHIDAIQRALEHMRHKLITSKLMLCHCLVN